MKKTLKELKKVLIAITLILSIANLTNSFANDNKAYDYTYKNVLEYGEQESALMNLNDNNGNSYPVYCLDKNTYVDDTAHYSAMNIEDAHQQISENANKIRNILLNSYPYITIEDLKNKASISNLTNKEAITGTQYAIWNYSNSTTKDEINSMSYNAKKMYEWYIALQEVESTSKIANIEISKQQFTQDDKTSVLIKFKANQNNNDSSKILLSYSFDKDIEKEYSAKISDEGIDKEDYNNVKIENLPLNASFSIIVRGSQRVNKNAFYYLPEEGKDNSQILVGVNDRAINISNSQQIDLSKLGYNLTINKLDAQSLNLIGGAEFEISQDKDFKSNVIKVNDETGKIIINELEKGMYYIKETKSPEGYIPNSDIMQVYINEKDVNLDIKNSKMGVAEVLKVDENKNNIKGAKFILYKDSVDENNVIQNYLETDENGKLEIKNLIPGNYILIEQYTPDDYILNSEPINFKINPYDNLKITHINETKGYGIIKICKKDAVTFEQLKNCKIGIYADSEYKQLLKTVIKKEDEEIIIDDLRPGTYYLKELEAPKGYLLDSLPKKIETTKNNTIEVVFYNSKNYSTAGNYANLMIIGGSVCTIGIIAYESKKIYLKKKKAKNEK